MLHKARTSCPLNHLWNGSSPQRLYIYILFVTLMTPSAYCQLPECDWIVGFEIMGSEFDYASDRGQLPNFKPVRIPDINYFPTVLPSNTSDFSNMTDVTEGTLLLNLSNTSPAVLDSEVTFRAILHNTSIECTKDFIYQWQSNVSRFSTWNTKGCHQSTKTVKFERPIKPAGYEMNVCVYRKTSHFSDKLILYELIAKGGMDFTLTELLNGHLRFQQNLPFYNEKNVFVTGEPLLLYTEIDDKIAHELSSSNFYWYQDGTLIQTTSSQSYIIVSFNISTDSVLNVVIVHTYTMPSTRVTAGALRGTDEDYMEKMGTFTHKITVKDPVSFLNVTGENSLVVGQNLKLNISYTGSAPIDLCWRILNGSNPGEVCQPTSYAQTSWSIFNITMPTEGHFDIDFTLKNDVSRAQRKHLVYAHLPRSVSSSNLAVTVICSLLGVMFVVFVAAYILRQQQKKKKPVEIAAFDFHPNMTAGQAHPWISKLRVIMQKLFKREHKPEYCLTDGLYGSMSDTDSICSQVL
ncbi:hypothetical protein ScPMuIL_003887 [Solemya velum]